MSFSGAFCRWPIHGRRITWTIPVIALSLFSQSALAEITQRELAQLVKQAIENHSVLYDPPRVSVSDHTLGYSAGRIFYPGYAPKPLQPLGFPIDVQFKIELLRKFRAKNKDELAFLEPYFVRMEHLVSDELALIKKNRGSQKELIKQLSERDDRARAILKEGIEKWAVKQGLTLAKESFAAAVIPSVTIKTVPAGGTVYYLNAVDYNVYKAAGILNQVDTWNQVAGEQIDMGGAYYFRATWPGGKTKQTAKILIDKDQTISLRAE